jgi:hypothetical protein
MYAYDLKNHRDLGKKQTFEITITPYRAMFFALSPTALQPAKVIALPTATAGGVHRVEIAAAMPRGHQAVKLTVKLPDGSVADWVEPVVVVDVRGKTVDVPVAYNDPKGKWTVLATDLYTGKTTSAQFGVR